MAFYDRLKEARVNAGLTQEQLADKLGIAKSTLSGYESGNREPTVATMAKAMEVLNIDANYLYQDEMDALGGNFAKIKYTEFKLLEKYRKLSDYDKETIDMNIDRMLNNPATSDSENGAEIIRIYPFLHNVASAGMGDYIADIPLDSIEAPYIKNADFVIGVCGDSMEPDFHNGDKLYVQKTDSLNVGDIGIFKKDGSLFLKEAGTDRLISHNGDYPDVYADSDNISVVGKVLGKVSN